MALDAPREARMPQSPHGQSQVVVSNARFTVIAPECIRLEYSERDTFIDAKSLFAVNRDAAFGTFELTQTSNRTVIDTGKIRLVYESDGKPFSPQNLTATIRKGAEIVSWVPGQVNRENLGGTIESLDRVMGPVDLGEGLLARDGWYILDDSQRPLLTEDWVASRPKDSGIDWYLFGYGTDYKAALRAMTRIGGGVPMPRKYALGVWYSRYWPYSSDEYREIVTEYERHNFPLDIVVLDMDWHKDGWTGWSWNRHLLPDAEALLTWLHEQKLFVTLNVHPADGVGPHEDMYDAFMRDLGRDPSTKEVLLFDAGDKTYLDTLFKHTHRPREMDGVDFWWLDWQQEPYTRSIPDLTNLAWLNHYYYQHSGPGNQRGLLLSRWGGWGDHRHPIHFSGDAYTDFPVLAFEVPFTSTASNVCCFFWSHDIGGHLGSRNEESYIRWIQFGALSAALRSHSERNEALDRRPWTYGAMAEAAMRRAFHLRSILFPYIYSSVSQCTEDTLPLVRPMYLEYPEREEAYRNPQQYYFGDALLVAPIAVPGTGPTKVATQTVWFPEGRWYNWFTGEKHSAGDAIVAADIDEFPLFVKGGVPVPTQPYTPRMTTTLLTELIIRCYPGDSGSYTLYEDDGLTNDYTKGEYAITELNYTRKGSTVMITASAVKGSYTGQVLSRSYVVELPCTGKAEAAEVDGEPVPIEYDEETCITRIRVRPRSIREAVKVIVEVEEANAEVLRDRAVLRRIQGLLGTVPVDRSLQDIVVAQKDSASLEALLAICGVAVHPKNEGVYMLKGQETLYVSNALELVDDDTFMVTVEDLIDHRKRVVLSKTFSVSGASPLALREVLSPAPADGTELNYTVCLEFKVNGQPLSISKTLLPRCRS